MNDGRNDCQRISRRVVLTGTALALGAAATGTAISQSTAQEKISQANVKYQSTPKGDQRCDVCVNFPTAECVQIRPVTLAQAAGATYLPRRHSFSVSRATLPARTLTTRTRLSRG